MRVQLQTLYVALWMQQAVMRVLGMEPSAAWKQKLGMRRLLIVLWASAVPTPGRVRAKWGLCPSVKPTARPCWHLR